VGFRIRKGDLTDIPAILVFVARKVHKKWLNPAQCLPAILEGPGGVWCDVDVVEFSYYGAPAQTPKEQMFSELVDKLCGSDECIGSGSQVLVFFPSLCVCVCVCVCKNTMCIKHSMPSSAQ
jgi:ribonuclease HIII